MPSYADYYNGIQFPGKKRNTGPQVTPTMPEWMKRYLPKYLRDDPNASIIRTPLSNPDPYYKQQQSRPRFGAGIAKAGVGPINIAQPLGFGFPSYMPPLPQGGAGYGNFGPGNYGPIPPSYRQQGSTPRLIGPIMSQPQVTAPLYPRVGF